jgi:hypothetical protein
MHCAMPILPDEAFVALAAEGRRRPPYHVSVFVEVRDGKERRETTTLLTHALGHW